jgi:hypothetical protein
MTVLLLDDLDLPLLMVELHHPEWPLQLMAFWEGDEALAAGLYPAPDDAEAKSILRVEAWVERGNQYIFVTRNEDGSWSRPEWGEHSDGAVAGDPVDTIREAQDGISLRTRPEDIHSRLRTAYKKKELPFPVVCLDTFPEDAWVGKTALHPGEQGAKPCWNTDDYAHKDADDPRNSLVFDLGVVLEVFEHPDVCGGQRCRFVTADGGSLHYGPDSLWVPVIGDSA